MKDKNIGIRISAEDQILLKTVCKARGEDISDFVRRSIKRELAGLSYYNAETKKALGIPLPAVKE